MNRKRKKEKELKNREKETIWNKQEKKKVKQLTRLSDFGRRSVGQLFVVLLSTANSKGKLHVMSTATTTKFTI